MSLFEEPHLEPQPEPEKPKKKKLLSVGIGAALIVAVLVTSVVAFSFGQSCLLYTSPSPRDTR